MANGFILLHRQIIDSAIFDNPNLLKFWIYCLCKATHTDHKQMVGLQEIDLKKGQFVFGRKAASQMLQFHDSLTYRCLKSLEKLGMIHVDSNNKFSIISIVNWEKYQDIEQIMNNKRTTDEQQKNNKRTTKEQQANTNNNDNNDNKKEKDTVEASAPTVDEFFNSVWVLLPSHRNDVKKNVKPARRKQLMTIGFDGIKKAADRYLSDQNPQFYHKRDNFFNNIIDNYLNGEQPAEAEPEPVSRNGRIMQ